MILYHLVWLVHFKFKFYRFLRSLLILLKSSEYRPNCSNFLSYIGRRNYSSKFLLHCPHGKNILPQRRRPKLHVFEMRSDQGPVCLQGGILAPVLKSKYLFPATGAQGHLPCTLSLSIHVMFFC